MIEEYKMPPKKSEAGNLPRKPIVGRLGTNLKMGIVGKFKINTIYYYSNLNILF